MLPAASGSNSIGHIASPVAQRECPVVVRDEVPLTPGAVLMSQQGFLLRVLGPEYASSDHEPDRLAEKMRMGLRIERAVPQRSGASFAWRCEILGRSENGRLRTDGAPAPGEPVSWADPGRLPGLDAGHAIGRLWPGGGTVRLSGPALSLPAGIFGDPGSGKTFLAQTIGELYLRSGVPVFAFDMSPDEEYLEWGRRLREVQPEIPLTEVEVGPRRRIPIHRLRPEELLEAAGILTRDQEDLLGAAVAELAREGRPWTRRDLEQRIRRIAEAQNRQTVADNLIRKLSYRLERLLDFLGDAESVLDPSVGGLHVFRLAHQPYRELIAAVICTLIEEMALGGRLRGGVVLIDEAHLVAPADRDIPSRYRIRYFVRLARHLNIVPWLISQSPRSVDRQVFDLLRFVYIFALSGENLAAVRDRLAGLHPRLAEQIPSLPTGVCLLTGPRDLLPFPIFMRAEGRRTEHPTPTRDIFRIFEGGEDRGVEAAEHRS
jgi:hypothetical protein